MFERPSALASTIRARRRIAALVRGAAASWLSAVRSATDNVSGDFGLPASGMAAS
ncbi:hypothetical protein JOF29_002038 [Kribbella aluminosa]|uniref:Uncharacterized protein n=1 Tax=Kribbella aluminosa TaxID=416017 RepID=A0ABS4UH51_9ACTN|nr:hypothetical protein [Kribbella aluminosa]MBP2350955.1 hypothetical protein [Kribbella aluminosa]